MSNAIAVLNAGSSSLKFSLFTVVFTAGIGENSAALRERACRDAHWLGAELTAAANAAGGRRFSTGVSRVSVWGIPTNDELMIARHALALLDRADVRASG